MSSNRRKIDGVLLFDKPIVMSSNSAMQKVRRLFRAEKAGHTGTLDPLATGLLPICLGEATKFSMGLLDADKTYVASVKLGVVTTTGDAEGEIVTTSSVNVNEAQFEAALQKLRGEILQLPPMHSALKFKGKPLYEYIRKGQVIERQPRKVFIHELQLVRREEDICEIYVRCSKGTYIRTLAEDIGKILGCGAHLTGLRRVATGVFRLDDAYSLEQLTNMDESAISATLLPIDSMLLNIQKIDLDFVEMHRLAQGQRLGLDHGLQDGNVRIYAEGKFAGLGKIEGRRLSPVRLISDLAKQAATRA